MLGCPIPNFPQFFPAFLGKKKIRKSRSKLGKVGQSRGKSGKIGKNWGKLGKSQLFRTYLKNFKRSGWPSRPILKCLDEFGTSSNPDLDFGSRSRWPPPSSLPIVTLHTVSRLHGCYCDGLSSFVCLCSSDVAPYFRAPFCIFVSHLFVRVKSEQNEHLACFKRLFKHSPQHSFTSTST